MWASEGNAQSVKEVKELAQTTDQASEGSEGSVKELHRLSRPEHHSQLQSNTGQLHPIEGSEGSEGYILHSNIILEMILSFTRLYSHLHEWVCVYRKGWMKDCAFTSFTGGRHA